MAESKYPEAISEYTAALKQAPTSPDYLIQRSAAYLRTKQYHEALADAEHAVVNATNRAKKEQIIEAQYRRACVLNNMQRYGDAQFLFGVVKRLKADHKQADAMINMVASKLKGLAQGDEKAKCTLKELPDLDASEATTGLATPPKSDVPMTDDGDERDSATPKISQLSAPTAPQQTPADKIRYEWYQNTTNIYFTLLVKGVPEDTVQVDITPRSLSVSFPLVSGASYDLHLEPLFAAVKPTECITRVMSTKIEIILVKETQGQKWSALESNEPIPTEEGGEPEKVTYTAPNPTAPAYPTSSKNGPKDWDKITTDTLNASKSPGEKGSAAEDDDYEGGDEANFFFKKLFKGASPEVQRAMNKSYSESGGTALSTNWEEVSKAKVEVQPPDGMEAKQWES